MISVVVPVYNTEKYLKKCIDSILGQDYRDIELLLVDDGSTDNSLAICQSYEKQDSRVKCIHTENGGQGRARNLALDVCKGEYIAFVDSDDCVLPDIYEKMLSAMQKENADMAVCGFIRNHGFYKRKQPCPRSNTVYDNAGLIQSYFFEPYITSCLWNKLYRRELWENIRFPDYRAREDIAVLYRVYARVQKAAHIGSCQYVQLVRAGSTERSSFHKNKLCALRTALEIKEFTRENYPSVYPLTLFLPAKTCVELMEECLSTSKDEAVYKELYGYLCAELQKTEGERQLNEAEYAVLLEVRDDQDKFRKKCRRLGRRNAIVNGLQKIYHFFQRG